MGDSQGSSRVCFLNSQTPPPKERSSTLSQNCTTSEKLLSGGVDVLSGRMMVAVV